MNSTIERVEDTLRRSAQSVLHNNLLLSLALSILALVALRAFSLERKHILRGFLLLLAANYAALRFSQDIRNNKEDLKNKLFTKPVPPVPVQLGLSSSSSSDDVSQHNFNKAAPFQEDKTFVL